ncbi:MULTISPECIES: helix-turn-helix domain-containing protein [unclassified Streptomyces]|uniref:helix-turn-helix domain-containing protein n=1 Tax=unclassified Streptomyces TaxID=2593676 RepID=UPI0011639A41|nr:MULTISPECIES: XRE family transcriptional regulator [unclassified Streptomyces]NMI62533.1 helix-turn-helix domain-containing protein [Streptomyces sp. RLA2-12]QDN61528.1 helix-turn-helix domain-containing protein [Streptomyces sp. S1D4-20]QDN71581.1 helix-turn-helix domain-containing protein [Streptomyces sp. S1D4-14]QDO54037.1 helix-turn-helix domain-containing protein [Streptomyces sp. RLB3-5]QDO64282.1 helix-turn-helix domain-containing protein [Streptomyces sp. RLB1-8]
MSPVESGAAATPPESAAAEALPAVAPQLRALRRRASLTLEAAARAAGLSAAHLSRLETGQRQPSLPMLLALARIYGTTVSELLGETVAERDAIVRAADMEPTKAGGWTYWQAGAPGRGMQALRVHVPYGSQGDIVRVHPGEEWLYVLQGRLRLRLGDTAQVLAPGDSAHFDSLTPHRIAAADHSGAELLFVHTLLQSPTAALCLGPAAGHPTMGELS